MKVYFDRITEDRILDDPHFPHNAAEGKKHSYEELENGMLFKVKGKMVSLFRSMIKYGLIDEKDATPEDMVIDLVSKFDLKELKGIDQETLRLKINEWIEKLTPMLLDEQKINFPKYMPAATEFLVNNLHNFNVYTGRMRRGILVFQYRDDPLTFLYLAHGLWGVR